MPSYAAVLRRDAHDLRTIAEMVHPATAGESWPARAREIAAHCEHLSALLDRVTPEGVRLLYRAVVEYKGERIPLELTGAIHALAAGPQPEEGRDGG